MNTHLLILLCKRRSFEYICHRYSIFFVENFRCQFVFYFFFFFSSLLSFFRFFITQKQKKCDERSFIAFFYGMWFCGYGCNVKLKNVTEQSTSNFESQTGKRSNGCSSSKGRRRRRGQYVQFVWTELCVVRDTFVWWSTSSESRSQTEIEKNTNNRIDARTHITHAHKRTHGLRSNPTESSSSSSSSHWWAACENWSWARRNT